MVLILLLAACTPPEDSAAPTPAVLSPATQNAGTSTSMAVVSDSPDEDVRADAEAWYGNNLCRLGTEAILRDTIAADLPDLVFLQEAWYQPNCDEAGRPPEMAEDPWVCSAGAGWQLERLLPEGWLWACATGYPDNCLAFPPGLAAPAGCDGRDCSALLLPSPAPCGVEGRIAYISLDTATGPLVAVVVHTNAGVFADDIDCRAAQLQGIQGVLTALPTETSIAMAGDFNLDPEVFEGADAEAYAELIAAVGLTDLLTPGVREGRANSGVSRRAAFPRASGAGEGIPPPQKNGSAVGEITLGCGRSPALCWSSPRTPTASATCAWTTCSCAARRSQRRPAPCVSWTRRPRSN